MADPIVPLDAGDVAAKSEVFLENEKRIVDLQLAITADQATLAQTRDIQSREPINERLSRSHRDLLEREQYRGQMLERVRADLATPTPAPAPPQPPPPLPSVVEARERARAEYAVAVRTNPMRAAELVEMFGPAVMRSGT